MIICQWLFCANVCLAIVTWLMLYSVCFKTIVTFVTHACVHQQHVSFKLYTISISYQACKPSIEGLFAGQAQRQRPCGNQGLNSASHVKLGAAGDARGRGCHAQEHEPPCHSLLPQHIPM